MPPSDDMDAQLPEAPPVAVMPLVATLTVIVRSLGVDRVTLKTNGVVPHGLKKVEKQLLPSFSDTSLIDRLALSSSTIVPTPCGSAIVAFVGLERLTQNVSSSSSMASPQIMTLTVCVVEPGVKVSVPDCEM